MHPNAAPLLVRGLAYSPAAKKRANVLLRMICRGGLNPAASATLISNLVALLVGHSLLALWVEREAGSTDGDGPDDERDPRTPRVWVHRLFRAETPDPDASGRMTGPAATMELPGDTVFLAGLEALIKGFVPD